MNNTILVLAPHLTYPTRSGADILIDQRWKHISSFVSHVDVIAQRQILRFQQGEVEQIGEFENDRQSKNIAAIKTIMYRSHYLRELFLTPAYRQAASVYVQNKVFGTMVCSYIFTAEWGRRIVLPSSQRIGKTCYVVETHNDEMRWYRNLAQASKNPLRKIVARQSASWAAKTFGLMPEDFLFLHVNAIDQAAYRSLKPGHKSMIAPVGVNLPNEDIYKKRKVSLKNEIIRLIFFGSLGVQMNQDALLHFEQNYFPALKNAFGERLEVVIAGSDPSSSVRHLCIDKGWKLYANVPEAELDDLLIGSTFTILPFPYTTGSKLKVYQSLAYGVPLLATETMRDHIPEDSKVSLISDQQNQWVEHIQKYEAMGGITRNDFMKMRRAVEPFIWQNISERVYRKLSGCELADAEDQE